MWSLLENSEGPRVFIYAREYVAGVGKYGPFSYFIFFEYIYIYIYIFWVGGGGVEITTCNLQVDNLETVC